LNGDRLLQFSLDRIDFGHDALRFIPRINHDRVARARADQDSTIALKGAYDHRAFNHDRKIDEDCLARNAFLLQLDLRVTIAV
jgi:hypothetical protein